MFVNGDLNRGARVQRSLDAPQDSFDPNRNRKHRNIVLNQQKPAKRAGFAGRLMDYFRTIYDSGAKCCFRKIVCQRAQ